MRDARYRRPSFAAVLRTEIELGMRRMTLLTFAQQAQRSITQPAVVQDTRRARILKVPMQMQHCITPQSGMPDTR